MQVGFTDSEIKVLFENMWKNVIISQYTYKGRKFDLKGILEEYSTPKSRRDFIAFVVKSDANTVINMMKEILEKHEIDFEGFICPYCFKRVNQQLKHLPSCIMYNDEEECQ